MKKLFGTDGIRGEANIYPMDGPTVFAIGQAVTSLLKKHNPHPEIVIGKDTRISGYMIEKSLESGIASMGGIPYPAGVIPTPGIAYLVNEMHADAGIMISASHNPYQDNGIKIFSSNGYKLSDAEEDAIETLIADKGVSAYAPRSAGMGTGFPVSDALARYTGFLKKSFPGELSIKGMKIVIDTANGATHKAAPMLFTETGADIEVIHNHPDGININDACGSQHTKSLIDRVIEKGADIGLAFDGDGDRLIVVDEKGRELNGEQTLLICAKALKDKGALKNNILVTTVMSNFGLLTACRKLDIQHHASMVGDRHVVEDMKRLGGIIGGEESGHMIFLEHHTTGDGMLAALQLLAVMAEQGRPLSELASVMELYPQELINVEVRNKPDIVTVPKIMNAIKLAEADLKDLGRVLVRYSGTQNMCRVMVEGPTIELTKKHCSNIADTIASVIGFHQ